jgi:hypothetical protein
LDEPKIFGRDDRNGSWLCENVSAVAVMSENRRTNAEIA